MGNAITRPAQIWLSAIVFNECIDSLLHYVWHLFLVIDNLHKEMKTKNYCTI